MYNKIYDIKNNKYISTQSKRGRNIISNYVQIGAASRSLTYQKNNPQRLGPVPSEQQKREQAANWDHYLSNHPPHCVQSRTSGQGSYPQ